MAISLIIREDEFMTRETLGLGRGEETGYRTSGVRVFAGHGSFGLGGNITGAGSPGICIPI